MNLTQDDVKRIIWTFVMAAGGVLIALAFEWFSNGGDLNWKVWAVAAVAAGISAVKNLLTNPGDVLK
jgi:hypothetical protein